MQSFNIEEDLKSNCPNLVLSCIQADVIVQEKNSGLWKEIDSVSGKIAEKMETSQISQLPAIASSRKAYKACGKDPARYRLSAEALLRRVVNGKGLYRINNVVDQLNLVSIQSGFSIGGYDAEKIESAITFGIGKNAEPYEGIGKGELNIEFLPVFRDCLGAFGTPTSDSKRTCVTNFTKRFLMIIINFGNSPGLDEATQMSIQLLKKYCSATNIELTRIKC